MNIQSITMEQALETLAQQSRLVPWATLLFYDRVSINSGTGNDPFPDTEPEELLEVVELPDRENETLVSRFTGEVFALFSLW